MQTMDVIEMIKAKIRNIPDFPIPGILFRDITPVLQDAKTFKLTIDAFADHYKNMQIDAVAAVEARGYIFASPIAYQLGAGVVLVRKSGKLPADKISEKYTLEYGSNVLEMHKDAVKPGQRILLVDDLIATGGSAAASKKMIESLGAKVVSIGFMIELSALNGREMLKGTNVFSLIKY